MLRFVVSSVVSNNIGYEDGVVNYYDSMYPVSSVTMQLIATLVFSPESEPLPLILVVGRIHAVYDLMTNL